MTDIHPDIVWHSGSVSRQDRERLLGQQAAVLWFTGLSGSGKSTVASALERHLHELGRLTYLLDGDNVRHGLNKGLGFSDADRKENLRRVAEVARLFLDSGAITLVTFISPFRAERELARNLMPDAFIEVFLDVPLDACESRDPKGLYRKARAGEIPDFTGISSPYEPPEKPELTLDTHRLDVASCVRLATECLRNRGVI